MLYLSFMFSFLLAIFLTPLVIKFAYKIGATDAPDQRKVHQSLMPRLGGLSIYFAFTLGMLIFVHDINEILPILLGGFVIFITGFLDDLYSIRPIIKLSGQFAGALITVLGGIQISYVTVPFFDRVDFGLWTIPISVIWIVAITNAINLIDGLDGLAAGVSSIALATIAFLAVTMGDPLTALLSILLLGSSVGFLLFNFNPAKIFMGDVGSLQLGYLISVFSIMGLYKNATLLSLISPLIILAIPIIDTVFAIVRRWVNNQPLSAPDKMHLHHRIIHLGYTHKQAVILIYMLSVLFSIAAIVYSKATVWGAVTILIGLLMLVELIVEITGLISEQHRPLLNALGIKKR